MNAAWERNEYMAEPILCVVHEAVKAAWIRTTTGRLLLVRHAGEILAERGRSER